MIDEKTGLTYLEKQVADFYARNMSVNEIAKIVGKTVKRINAILDSEKVSKYVFDKQDKIAEEMLDKQYRRAIEVRGEILENGKSEINRLAAANAIIKDRRDGQAKDNTFTVVFGNVATLGVPKGYENENDND